MITRVLAAAAVAGSVLVAGGAQAEPYAGQYRYLDTGRLSLHGADGARWVLRVVATRDGAAQTRTEQRMYVDLDRCLGQTCAPVGRWVEELASSAISIDGPVGYQPVSLGSGPAQATGTLTARLAGRVLQVRLGSKGGGGAGAFHGVGLSPDPPGAHPQVSQWKAATGSLRLAGLACTVAVAKGELGEAELVDSVGDDVRDPRSAPPERLPAGLLSGPRAPRC